MTRTTQLLMLAATAAAGVLLAPRAAQAACEGPSFRPYDLAPGRCPAVNDCIVIDESFEPSSVTLPSSCSYVGVEFRIERSDFTFDCGGATLDGTKASGKPIAIQVFSLRDVSLLGEPVGCNETATEDVCAVDRPGVSNVTVQNCTIEGYSKGVSVLVGNGLGELRARQREIYLEYYDHPNERECRISQLEDCLRAAAPHDITIQDVDATRQGNVGIYLEQYANDVTVQRCSMTWSEEGPGLYLAPGSRSNLILNNTISDNGREGIAIDASAGNEIADNVIEENGRKAYEDVAWFFDHKDSYYEAHRIGIAIFRNTWENRWDTENPQGPRNPHARANLIHKNTIINHRTGVYVGFRQQRGVEAPGEEEGEGDPVYWHTSGNGYYHRQFAEENAIVGNTFHDHKRGILVYDNDTTISGNSFTDGIDSDIDLGSDVRRLVGEPVHGTVITGNQFTPGLTRAIWQRECAVDTEIVGNSTDTPVTVACDYPRAKIHGHLASGATTYEVGAMYRRGGPIMGTDQWLTGDFDGNGRRNDLAHIYFSGDGRARVWIHVGGTTKFEYQSGFQTFDFTEVAKDGQWLAGQFDGQPGDDLVYIEGGGSSSNTCFRGFTSVGTGFLQAFNDCRFVSSVKYEPHHRWLVGDFNGDGGDDLVEVHGTLNGTSKIVPHRRDYGFIFATGTTLATGVMDPTHRWLMGDWNGDGRDDLARIFANSNGDATAWVQLSTGNAFAAMSFLASLGGASFSASQTWLKANFDGDADDDIVLVYGASGEANARRFRSNGTSFSRLAIQILGPFHENQRYVPARLDTDATDDLIMVGQMKWYPDAPTDPLPPPRPVPTPRAPTSETSPRL